MQETDSGGRDEDEEDGECEVTVREVTVEVTEDDIRSARWGKTYDCPVARAVRRTLRIDIYASNTVVRVVDHAGGLVVEISRRAVASLPHSRVIARTRHNLSKAGMMFVRNWDCWGNAWRDEDDRPIFASGLPEHIQPFSFSMSKPNFLP